MSIYLPGITNPFNLPTPKNWWLQPIQDYDSDLRIFPSQKHPVYVLARKATRSGGMMSKLFGAIPGLHPNTRILLQHQLVHVSVIPREALNAPPQNIVQELRERDQWAVGGGQDAAAGDVIADRLDARDESNRVAQRQRFHDDGRLIHESARISLLYKLGARVSLVRPPSLTEANSPSSGAQPPAIPPTAGTSA
jgi:hypothetical protein